ncbi:TIM44-like domain-containing protein [Bosea sp. 117]|uniref:Tim44 domain-containing protein n=1 Tax=Bosea sp. 117 TaxID=1125973 RepID=UPI0005700D90|nr:TIM44-like domain-containing protein [Bosea sp. 117]
MPRALLAVLALAAGLMVATDFAEARVGRSGSFGSRGSRTWSTPAPTPTAPTAQPMQRSATPNTTQPGATQPGVTQPGAAARPAGGLFNRPGLMGGLMGGLLGAGIFGLLMGTGFFSGLGSLAGILGFVLQMVLIVIVARLVLGWWRSRNQQPSYAGGPAGPRPGPMSRDPHAEGAASGSAMGAPDGAARAGFGTGPRGKPLKLAASDFDSFERTLGEVQEAYGRDDRATLDRLLTPEMAGYIGEELDELARDGLVNRLSDVKLLQGDLSEAWSEPDEGGTSEYATVAMRYELKDALVERATGRLVQGDPDRPTQATEFWTFVRRPGGAWKVSAIQQG